MATAAAFVAYASSLIGKPYGSGSGALQRGPDSFDCIGFWRWCVLHVAPELWPTSWGGPDSWEVPNYVAAWKAHRLPYGGPGVTIMPADALVFGDLEHIGAADGRGNCISALDPAQGVCSVPIKAITPPLTLVLQTRLEHAMATPDTPVGIARIADDPAVRGIRPDGTLVALFIDTDMPVYGTEDIPGHSVTGEATSPAYVIADPLDGSPIALLERNVAAYAAIGSATPDPEVATLQAKIDAAKAALA